MEVTINPPKISISAGNIIVKGNVNVRPLAVTENGTYQEDDVAYSPVTVDVAGIVPTGEINITENGDYDVTDKATAHVAVPEPSGSVTITENGQYNVKDYATAVVNVPPPLVISKKITANGEYYAEDDGAFGYSDVTVDVPGIVPPHEVPDGYTQLKYLESSGTQYINTDVAPALEIKLQVQGFYLNGNGSYYPLAGSTNPPIIVGSVVGPGATTAYNSFGNITDKQIQNPWAGCDTAPIFTIDKAQAQIENPNVKTGTVALNATSMSGNASTRIALFGRGNAGSFERLSKARIYRVKIWDNGTLVRDFVPAMRNLDEVLGMYDIVGGAFDTNDGTGVFTGGTYA